MLKEGIVSITSVIVLAFCGCDKGEGVNTAAGTKPTQVSTPANSVQPADLPPGINTSPIVTPTNPANAASNNGTVSHKTAATPGIPSAEEIKKMSKSGPASTPGIPSEDELKRAFSRPVPDPATGSPNMAPSMMKMDVNNAMKPSSNNVPMKKTKRKLGGKP